MFTFYLQWLHGFTCGIDDMVLDEQAELDRARLVRESAAAGARAAADWCLGDDESKKERTEEEERARVKAMADNISGLRGSGSMTGMSAGEEASAREAMSRRLAADAVVTAEGEGTQDGDDYREHGLLDAAYKQALMPATSKIIERCLPGGLVRPFPRNCLVLMTNSGAKGSGVNHSMISCCLGQQELEGKRVPQMASGKTLPSFVSYALHPRSGGYISDRFLTGIRPQEYYFHCMSGREGLVDTAVKTSRSGYLQRCLVKHMENLRIAHDSTVRDCDGGVVQFTYGEDGVDPCRAAFVDGGDAQFNFICRNLAPLAAKYNLTAEGPSGVKVRVV